MADTGIFATTAEVGYKAGSGASATSKAEAYVNNFMTQVEAEINSTCRFNFSDVYTALNVDTKGVLKEIASNMAAIYVIIYDMSGYASRIEAEDLINVLRDAALRGLALLKDKKVTDFVRSVA
jgi:hypothetical protein